jgi:hypothetical protein
LIDNCHYVHYMVMTKYVAFWHIWYTSKMHYYNVHFRKTPFELLYDYKIIIMGHFSEVLLLKASTYVMSRYDELQISANNVDVSIMYLGILYQYNIGKF